MLLLYMYGRAGRLTTRNAGFRPGQEISNDYFEASIKKIAECVEHRDRDQSYAGDEGAGNSAMPEDNAGDKKND